MKKRSTSIISFIICLVMLTACGGRNTGNVTEKPESSFLNLGAQFVPMNDALADEPFEALGDDYNGRTYRADAVLYGDKKGNITVEFEGNDAYISLYGAKYKASIEAPLAINIVDLDTSDEYRELAIWTEGPSADPGVDFFRFNGKEVVPLNFYNSEYDYTSSNIYGFLDADKDDILPTYGAIWTDGKGRVVTSFQNVGFIEKRVALSCFELDGDRWVEKELEPTGLIGEHTVAGDFKAFFTPSDNSPLDLNNIKYFQNFDPKYVKEFKKGEKIKIIDYAPLYSYYTFYIEYQGERGVIAFWLGD